MTLRNAPALVSGSIFLSTTRQGGFMSSPLMRFSGGFLAAVLLAALWTGNVFGQAADGNIVGAILDPTGAVVTSTTVEAENTATGVKTTTRTDESGFYRFNNLLVGKYKVTATAAGF